MTVISGLFLAIPYGYLADKYGRKWLMVLNSVSITLRFIWIYIVCEFYGIRSFHIVLN